MEWLYHIGVPEDQIEDRATNSANTVQMCIRDSIDTAVKVLIAVVLGALVLAGLYAILNDTVMPTVTQKRCV